MVVCFCVGSEIVVVCEVTVVTVACGVFVGCVVMVSAFDWVITAVVRSLVDVSVIETAVVVTVTVVGGATVHLIRGDDVIVALVVCTSVLDSSLVDTVEIVEESSC